MNEEFEFDGVLVLDEDACFLDDLFAAIPEEKLEPVTVPVVHHETRAPAVAVKPSPAEEARQIEAWLAQKKEEAEKARAEKLRATKAKKEEKKVAKPAKPEKEKQSERPIATTPTNVEEKFYLDKPESIEEEEVEREEHKSLRLVRGQWKLSYDSEASYKREVAKHEVPTPEEERELFMWYAETKSVEAWDKLIMRNQRLVAMHAKRYSLIYHVPFMDAVQEGNFGLMHAIRRFDLERECRLSTYATWWIKQSIERWIMDTNRMIRLPVHVHDLLSKARKASLRYFKKFGHEPTNEELAKELGISVKRLANVQEGFKKVVSMDASINAHDEDGDQLLDFIADDKPLQDESMHREELSQNVIIPALAQLEPRGRFVITMRFGIVGCMFTEEDIAKAIQLPLEEVRALEYGILQKLDPPERILFNRNAAMKWLSHADRSMLTPQEDLLFILRYGIGAVESTLEEIAERVSVTRERIRQLEEKAMPKLRRCMEKHVLKNELECGAREKSTQGAVSAAVASKGIY